MDTKTKIPRLNAAEIREEIRALRARIAELNALLRLAGVQAVTQQTVDDAQEVPGE